MFKEKKKKEIRGILQKREIKFKEKERENKTIRRILRKKKEIAKE